MGGYLFFFQVLEMMPGFLQSAPGLICIRKIKQQIREEKCDVNKKNLPACCLTLNFNLFLVNYAIDCILQVLKRKFYTYEIKRTFFPTNFIHLIIQFNYQKTSIYEKKDEWIAKSA